MEGRFREEGRRRALRQSKQALEEEVARLRERRARVELTATQEGDADSERELIRRELDAALVLVEDARTEWVRDQQEAATKRDALRASYLEIKQQRDRLADLGPESPCPICTRPLADHFREVLDDLDGKLTAIEVDGRYFSKRVEQLEDMPEPLRDRGAARGPRQGVGGAPHHGAQRAGRREGARRSTGGVGVGGPEPSGSRADAGAVARAHGRPSSARGA